MMLVGRCSDEVDGNHDLHAFKCGGEDGTNCRIVGGCTRYIIAFLATITRCPSLPQIGTSTLSTCFTELFLFYETSTWEPSRREPAMRQNNSCWVEFQLLEPRDQQGFGACRPSMILSFPGLGSHQKLRLRLSKAPACLRFS